MDYTDTDARNALRWGVSRERAAQIHEAKLDEIDAAYAKRAAAERAQDDADRESPVTAKTAAAIAKKFDRGIKKPERQRMAQWLGSDWERIANPQTREAAIAGLTELTARKVLGR